jgi:outer membrane protein TolC
VRSRAGAQFQAAQAQALGEIDTASTRYRAAYAALSEARRVEDLSRDVRNDVDRRLMAGAADRGEVLTAQLGVAVAERATLDALRGATDALGLIEDGVQRPVWPASHLTPKRPDDSLQEPIP